MRGVVVLLALCGLAAGVRAEPLVERISFAARPDAGGYVVRFHTTDHLGAYSEPRFVAPGRLEVILFNTSPAPGLRADPPAGPVRRVETEARGAHLYITFVLEAGARVRAGAYRDRASPDLLVGLAVEEAAPVVPAIRAALSPGTEPAPAPADAPDDPAMDDPAMDDARARWRLDTIVIDAGHGGHDSGAVGAGGLREKDVVLPVALKVGQYLEERLGVKVVYTRNGDRFVTLAERGRIANRAGGKLFISIHANAATNRRAQGAETYFLGLHKTDAARSVMERENSVVRYENDPDAYEGLDQQALIVQALAQSAYLRQSEALAALVQNQFEERVGRIDRGVKQAGFYVLWRASMPAILVELGFVTNPEEAAYLRSEAGQDYLASAIFRAVRAFKEEYEKGLAETLPP